MTAEPLPVLCSDVPGAPRTETAGYRFPPAFPMAPSPINCTPDDLLRLAIDAARLDVDLQALCNSPAHVRAICSWAANVLEPQVSLLADQLAVAQGIGAELEKRLAAEIAAAGPLVDRCVASSQDANLLRQRLHHEQEQSVAWQQQCANLAAENGWLRTSNVNRICEVFDLHARLDLAQRVLLSSGSGGLGRDGDIEVAEVALRLVGDDALPQPDWQERVMERVERARRPWWRRWFGR